MDRSAGYTVLPLLLGAFILVGCEAPTSPDSNDATARLTPQVAYKSGQARIDMCHRTGSEKNPWVKITIAVPAEGAHRAHGDLAPGEPLTPAGLFVLDDACQVVAAGSPGDCEFGDADNCAGDVPGPGNDDDGGISLP